MIRLTAFVHVDPSRPGAAVRLAGALGGAVHELPLLALEVSPPTPQAVGAGQLMVLGAFADPDQCEDALRHPYVLEVVRPALDADAVGVDAVRYDQGPVVLGTPGLRGGIQRTLLLSVRPGADPVEVARFERALAAMGRYIGTIRNSSLSRIDPSGAGHVYAPTRRWTHVWEQEFESLEGLTGEYMTHPYHWAYVDTWFDPHAPNWVVHSTLVHAMCDLDHSILSLA